MHITETTPVGTRILPEALPLVLMIEDNQGDIDLLGEALRESKVAVRLLTATDAIQAFGAVRLLAGAMPRLILIDLNLPTGPGTGVLRDLTQHPQWRTIPKLVLTASQRDTDRIESLRLGAREFVTKPSSYAGYLTLVDHLRQYLAQ